MAHQPLVNLLRHVHRLVEPAGAEASDGELLQRFAAGQDESAFEGLMQRHGPMVLSVCRGVLRDPHDAEDAFQATFLVLARKATSIQKQSSVASWLYGVAHRIALRAKVNAGRRSERERQAIDMSPEPAACDVDREELRSVLGEEIRRLPDKYRAPLVLCYLEGKTNEIAAQELGWPRGSIGRRLNRARELLRDRLAHRGVALSGAGVAAVLAETTVSAAVPASLFHSTLKAATLFAAGQAATGAIPASVVALAEGALHTMTLTKLKLWAGLAAILILMGGGVGLLAFQNVTPSNNSEQPVRLPDNPSALVLTWNAPRLSVRADGSIAARDNLGTATARLPHAELDALMRFLVREQNFFNLVTSSLPNGHGSLDRQGAELTMRLRLCADGQDHQVEWTSGQMQAIQRRLEWLESWTYAGGTKGVQAALASINDQVHRQLSDAPELTAADLQSVRREGGSVLQLTFERRGVAADGNPFSFVFGVLDRNPGQEPKVTVKANLLAAASPNEALPELPLKVNPPPIASDKSVKWDYPIVYVRAPRFNGKTPKGTDRHGPWAEISNPTHVPAGADLMLLNPDGREEVLLEAGKGSVQDLYVSFDGKWVYYTLFHDPKAGQWTAGADIYKMHVPSRKIVRLTQQQATPNTGVADWSTDFKTRQPGKVTVPHGIYNIHPCPLPGGRVAFVSNRDSVKDPQGYPVYALQLYVMDDDGNNVEKIGHLNVAGALHPVVLKDGRIIFSSLESQGLRGNIQWGIWSIHPDGTNWGPVVSAFMGDGASDALHFQSQLSDGSIIVEEYYNQNTLGFGTYYKLPPQAPDGYAPFGPASTILKPDSRLVFWGRNTGGITHRSYPFSPVGMEVLTRFAPTGDFPAGLSDPKDKQSPRVGKVTHPCGAPDNHLLTVWSPGGLSNGYLGPYIDGGLYLIKSGKPIWAPGEMLLIKNDPKYNEMWPRPLVSYKRIYGVEEPKRLTPLANDGKTNRNLPEGTPFGLVGTSSLYKRESATFGTVPPGGVTAKGDPYAALGAASAGYIQSWSWGGQGADAGLYENSDIHAIRILFMEPATSVVAGKFHNSANERLRIGGEFPVRKLGKDGKQPLDPDGNPDTSFLAKIPADVAWTFQTLDKHGMVLNMAQTWHQLRPGEIRNDCGGCHAHSQKPTEFKLTAAAKPDYLPWDLTKRTPLLTNKKNDQSGKKWDTQDETGVRYASGPLNVEYFRDVRPILDRSCVACHNQKNGKPAANLALDEDIRVRRQGYHQPMPATYFRLAAQAEQYTNNILPFGGSQPKTGNGFNNMSRHASPYIVKFQSRRSLLIWKLFGRRLDGLPEKPLPGRDQDHKRATAIDFKGSIMPPPKAVEGTYDGPDGKKVKVAPLTDEDRRTIVRWIDLGCPIDLDYDPAKPQATGRGWMLDDQRPTLTLTYPQTGTNPPLTRILVGMHDYYSGLEPNSFEVKADFAIDGVEPGQNLASKFKTLPDNRWELRLGKPLATLPKGKLTVSVKDKQGNVTKIERTFSVGDQAARR